MNNEHMRRLIEAYGADPARWPARDCDAAPAVPLDATSALERELQQARALDRALDTAWPTVPLPDRLRARILLQAPQARGFWWTELGQALGGLRLFGPAFACAFSLGLGLAWMLPGQNDPAAAGELEDYLSLAWIDPAVSEELP